VKQISREQLKAYSIRCQFAAAATQRINKWGRGPGTHERIRDLIPGRGHWDKTQRACVLAERAYLKSGLLGP